MLKNKHKRVENKLLCCAKFLSPFRGNFASLLALLVFIHSAPRSSEKKPAADRIPIELHSRENKTSN